jgi:hypothetical protein
MISRQLVGLTEPLIPHSRGIGDPDIVDSEGLPLLVLENDEMSGPFFAGGRCDSQRDRSGNAPI